MRAVRGRRRQTGFTGALAASLMAWGCGPTTTTKKKTDEAPPLVWPALKPNCAVALDGRSGRHCAVYQDGSVWCWGGNLGIMGDVTTSRTPRRVNGVEGAERVVVGIQHNCAWGTNGLLCWGANESRQIDDSGRPMVPPTSPQLGAPEPSAIKGVALDSQQTCVLDSLSHIRCRGFDFGAAENRGPTQVTFPGPPDTTMPGPGGYVLDDKGKVYVLDNWAEPSARPTLGSDNAWLAVGRPNCVLKRSGNLWCDSDRTEAQSNTLIAVASLGERVTQATTGNGFMCALSEGKVWCQGDNQYGQTGTGDRVRAPTHVVEGLEDVRAISADVSSACALKGDGSVWCWGQDPEGRLDWLSPLQVSECIDQTTPPAELPPLSTTPADPTARFTEAALARAQAMCGCVFAKVPDPACVEAANVGPNQLCLEGLGAAELVEPLTCRATQLFEAAECDAKQVCTEKGIVQACLPSSECPPIDNWRLQYCRRTFCLDNEKPLLPQFMCDGAPYCKDGSDERNCQPSSQSFDCEGDVKIAPSRVCDGTWDCADGSDERFCE